MPSTYSPSLRLELIGNGEQAGTWGTTTNNNLGTLIEQAVTGVQPITLTGGDYTLTDYNGLPDESRNAVLVLGGLLAAPCNVIAPASEKTYIVRNFSNATVTIKTAAGNGVALTNAASAVVFCDGTDFYSATTLNYIDGNLTVTGSTNLQGPVTANSTVTINGNVTITSNTASIFANASTAQVFLPVGTDAQRSASPTNGLIRYNEEQNFYEGYANNTWVRFLVANQGSFTLYYHLVGGGGGVSSGQVAGGGAGQVLENSVPTSLGTAFTITIGAGAAGGTTGGTTTLSGVTSAVGGGGATGSTGATSGNGYAGGAPFSTGQTGGGGGGAGGTGGPGTEGLGGYGGIGLQTNITGTPTYYGGGGSGGGQFGGQGGGQGGGAAAFGNGTANTGGGGGGTYGSGATNGGSGRVTIKVLTLYYSGTYTGTPTISTIGDYTCLTYTASGTYTA